MALRRLFVVCEGQTEEAFVTTVLRPYLTNRGCHDVRAVVLKRGAGQKGGWTNYAAAKRFIRKLMAGQGGPDVWFTTLLDLYAIPGDFPGLAAAPRGSARARTVFLEDAFDTDVGDDDHRRFMGHLQLHEFEALLLVDPDRLAAFFPERRNAAACLRAAIGCLEPEDIDGGPQSAPSKRIIACIPEYAGRKVVAGAILTGLIGIDRTRAACPHFDAWLARIEAQIVA